MKMLCLVLVSSVFALVAVSETANEVRPLVETKLGTVEGLSRTSFDGRKYASYEGVPYAKPPIGELRFEESQPVEGWPGVWNATQQYKCPQASIYSADDYLGSEDCLYLNIYVPEVNPPKKLDVVVHIHAGCFMWGYNQEFLGDKYFMDRDVILVSMNYRLNAFGFLSTEDEVVPGNNGLKDQRLALKWIHQNIHSFGGNPNSITITGFSAGAASVQYHYLSPGSKGLFNRGMSASGSALGPWAVQEQPMKMTRRLAKVVGCDFESSKDLVACLKTRPVRLLLESMVKHVYPMFTFPLCPYAPVLEKGGENSFLTKDPYVLLKSGEVADLPWINSYTTDDGLVASIAFFDRVDEILNSWSDSFPYITETYNTMPAGKSEEIGKKIWDFYLSTGKTQKEQFDQLTKMSTDRLLGIPNEKSAEMQSRVTKSPVYFYVFDFHGNHSLRYDLHKNPPPGVCHGDDMVYMFGGLIKKPLSENEINMKNIMMDFLESYATKGVPTLKGVRMESIKDKFVFYKISGSDDIQKKIKTDYSIDNFWSSLALMEYENLLPSKEEL